MIFKKKNKDFFKNFIKTEGLTTGVHFTVYLLEGMESFFGTRIEFDKNNPDIVHLYNENQSEWEQKRTATDTYFHIDEVFCIQKSYPINNDPNIVIKDLLEK